MRAVANAPVARRPRVPDGAATRLGRNQKRQAASTADQNLRYQQNLSGRGISILELSTNKLRRIEAAADLIQAVITAIKTGEFRQLEIP
jgi:hypothetical protein